MKVNQYVKNIAHECMYNGIQKLIMSIIASCCLIESSFRLYSLSLNKLFPFEKEICYDLRLLLLEVFTFVSDVPTDSFLSEQNWVGKRKLQKNLPEITIWEFETYDGKQKTTLVSCIDMLCKTVCLCIRCASL